MNMADIHKLSIVELREILKNKKILFVMNFGEKKIYLEKSIIQICNLYELAS